MQLSIEWENIENSGENINNFKKSNQLKNK